VRGIATGDMFRPLFGLESTRLGVGRQVFCSLPFAPARKCHCHISLATTLSTRGHSDMPRRGAPVRVSNAGSHFAAAEASGWALRRRRSRAPGPAPGKCELDQDGKRAHHQRLSALRAGRGEFGVAPSKTLGSSSRNGTRRSDTKLHAATLACAAATHAFRKS